MVRKSSQRGGETEQDVLRAIAKASFETAAPIGLGVLQYRKGTVLTDEQADRFINLGSDRNTLNMDYVEGRQVKTIVYRQNGCLVFSTHAFEYARENSKPMLERAKEILSGSPVTGQLSTERRFEGEDLDRYLKTHYGLERNQGESDWAFRQRVFPGLYQQHPDGAIPVLFGGTLADFDDMDQMMVLLMADCRSEADLQKFARGFAADPIVMRRQRKQARV